MMYLITSVIGIWHNVAVSYAREFERETYVWVYIDGVLILETSIFDWHVFDSNSQDYWFHIGYDFPGIVRKAKVNLRPYCYNS
jgi:hypothetical protein